ncbi:actin interacting protein 3-domain-containing protein [Pilaira anomala]|nr:actin interacting protein 3-domain-containing protein [Pilaira anomala]
MKRINNSGGASGEIEQVVTKLLRTTKALLEALTQWSHSRASNADIFEIHDTLEKQFFLVSQTFEESNVFMNDLQWIPRQLRDSVSVAMLEPPSPTVLDQYLPRIREVIVHLLHGLKGKQAMLRERGERESRASMRSSSESWNREVPLAALNRTSGSQRVMMYPVPNSPPLPPVSPRLNNASNEYDPWSGGMPRPSLPTNDLSSRIMPRNNSLSRSGYSPQQSPSMQHQPLPTRSTSSSYNNMPSPPTNAQQQQQQQQPPPPPPPAPPAPPIIPPVTNELPVQQQRFDESDPNTASALAALKRQENLARRSSVRRASMFRVIVRKQQYYQQQQQQSSENNVPPVPTLPTNEPNRLNTVTEETRPVTKEKKPDEGLTLFFRLEKEVQKVSYHGEISIPALNMLFLEKFSDSILDLTEVKDRSVLSLNINEKEEQKELLLQVTTTFNKELEETLVIPTPVTLEPVVAEEEKVKDVDEEKEDEGESPNEEGRNLQRKKRVFLKNNMNHNCLRLKTLRRDMSVLRQLEREMREGTNTVIQELKEKAESVKEEASKNKKLEQTQSVARTDLEEGKKNLLEKSDKVTSRLEELQDTIDQLKLDVTQRKCRPSETMMTHCANERKALSAEIEEFGSEYLLSDMKDDLDALLEVFEQLEKIYAYQASTKPQPRQFRVAPVWQVCLKQVSTIDVDHTRRLRALEQADKMRQRELANRIDDFEKELVGFVGENKLKKTGGALEIDRLRKQKEEEMMKAMYNANKKPGTPST